MGSLFSGVGRALKWNKMERMSRGGNAAGLIGMLDDEDLDLRSAAIDALVKIGPTAVQPLMEALSHPATRVRGGAAVVLGELGDGRALSGLVGRLSDPEMWVRRNAARALGHLRAPAAEKALAAQGCGARDLRGAQAGSRG